jgi:hypothetical protein
MSSNQYNSKDNLNNFCGFLLAEFKARRGRQLTSLRVAAKVGGDANADRATRYD